MEHREITLSRDCKVVLIPSGEEATLTAGSPVIITQSLGGTYTVATQTGLARIAENDADALGIAAEKKEANVKPEGVIAAGGEVKDVVGFFYEGIDESFVGDAAAVQHGGGRHEFFPAGGEIVEDGNVGPELEQFFSHARAHETGASGDKAAGVFEDGSERVLAGVWNTTSGWHGEWGQSGNKK
jgi:hypothetical protein